MALLLSPYSKLEGNMSDSLSLMSEYYLADRQVCFGRTTKKVFLNLYY